MSPSRVAARRLFLTQTLALASVTASGLTAGSAQAIEPIGRDRSKFKFSLAAYSYRSLLQGERPKLTLNDFVDDCAKFGLEGTELTSYYFAPDVTDDQLRSLKRHCFRQGLDVSGTAIGNDFGHLEAEKHAEQIRLTKRWIDRAAVLGAPVIRIFAGHQHDGADAEQTHRQMVAGIEECCDYAGQHGVHLALENHGGPTATAAGLLRFVQDVKSDWFGVNMDTGNFHSADVYAELEQIAPYALNVQVKVTVTGPDGTKRPTDWQRIATILKQANYQGYVVLEFEEAGDPRVECERYLDVLRSALRE
ncbi:MAG: sugar phosphate isomerase/epimerase [Planctomycetales bacterium]|nr:sugar phosphate isomerase/epimerase [Planctomycetales bacterium]MCA9169658.1 sugar phosphate isomerase/epimerase [Planctomycetales bacterium]